MRGGRNNKRNEKQISKKTVSGYAPRTSEATDRDAIAPEKRNNSEAGEHTQTQK
jgi:hypothetical protein